MKDLWLGQYSQSGITPVVEVEPLILKYARKLEFGSSTQKVAEDAVRIIKRMNRDWMVTGRRPAGLCGACIILAARMNNFRRTVREVVYIVKVADLTIAKRLEEFKRTKSSTLTVEEFRKFGHRLKQQHDPPALYEAQVREEKKRKRTRQLDDEEPQTVSDEESNRTKSPAPATPAPRPAATLRRDADGFAIPDIPIDPALLTASEPAQTNLGQGNESSSASVTAQPTAGNQGRDVPESSKSGPKKRGRPPKSPSDQSNKRQKVDPPALTPQDLLVEEELENEIERIITDPDTLANVEDTVFQASHARSKLLADKIRGPSDIPSGEEIGEDEFADDPEVANCVLSPEETAIKERIWVTHNEDWLRAQQAKLLKKTLEEASGVKKAPRKKRKHGRMGDGSVLEGGTPILSPADANQRMLEKRAKGFSRLINYEKLSEIYKGFGSKGAPEKDAGEDANKAGNSASASVASGHASPESSSEPAKGATAEGAEPKGDPAPAPEEIIEDEEDDDEEIEEDDEMDDEDPDDDGQFQETLQSASIGFGDEFDAEAA